MRIQCGYSEEEEEEAEVEEEEEEEEDCGVTEGYNEGTMYPTLFSPLRGNHFVTPFETCLNLFYTEMDVSECVCNDA